MGFFDSIVNTINPVNAINPFSDDKNPFSGRNPVTGQPGLGIFGGGGNDPKTSGDPYAGRPGAPSYRPSYDMGSMNLSNEANSLVDANKMDTRGMDKYRSEALRTGPSAWAQLAGQQADSQEQDALNKTAQSSRAQTAEAQSNLAMRGGLNSGARERIAAQGAGANMAGAQDVRRQADANHMQIGLNDEQNRMTQLGQLPGMEISKHQSDMGDANTRLSGRQFDIQNQIGEGDKHNLFDLQRYNSDMTAWAANQQANATAAAGSGGKKGGK